MKRSYRNTLAVLAATAALPLATAVLSALMVRYQPKIRQKQRNCILTDVRVATEP